MVHTWQVNLFEFGPLVPLTMLACGAWRWRAGRLVAAALAVSVAGDLASDALSGAWWVSYLWLPVQFGLAIGAFAGLRLAFAGTLGLALCAVVLTHPGPDWLLSLVGSVWVLRVTRGILVLPVYIYFGLGSVLYLWWVLRLMRGGDHMVAWRAYQWTRVAAFAVLAVVLLMADERKA